MLTILYRACDKELESIPTRVGRPSWFSKVNCFKSLHNSYLNCKYKDQIKIIILMDGDKSILSDEMEKLDYTIIYNKVRSNYNSLQFQLDYSEKISEGNIYFAEDDYLYTLDALDHIYTGVERFGLITGYDHPDRYTNNDDICLGNESIYFHEAKHWRTCESTTCSWAVSRNLISHIIPIAKRFGLEDRLLFRHLYQNNIRLYSPIPGIATTVYEPVISFGIDWKNINMLISNNQT